MLVRRRARSPTSLHRGRCAARLDDWRLAESRATRAAATRLVVPQQPPQSQPDHGHNQPWITTAEVCAAPFGSPARLPFKNFSDARLARATRRFSERRFSAPNQQWITTAEVCAATFGEFRVGSVARRPARRADRPRARSIGVLADGRRGLAVLAQPCAAVGGERNPVFPIISPIPWPTKGPNHKQLQQKSSRLGALLVGQLHASCQRQASPA